MSMKPKYIYKGIFDSSNNEMLLESRSFFKYRGYCDNTMNDYAGEINEGTYYVITEGCYFSYILQKALRFFKHKGKR